MYGKIYTQYILKNKNTRYQIIVILIVRLKKLNCHRIIHFLDVINDHDVSR